jgi:hypothetical protein
LFAREPCNGNITRKMNSSHRSSYGFLDTESYSISLRCPYFGVKYNEQISGVLKPYTFLITLEYMYYRAFSLRHSVQIGSGALSAFYEMGTGGSLPRGKVAGA